MAQGWCPEQKIEIKCEGGNRFLSHKKSLNKLNFDFSLLPFISYLLVIFRKLSVNAEGSGKWRGNKRKEWKKEQELFWLRWGWLRLSFWIPAPSFAGTMTCPGMCADAWVIHLQIFFFLFGKNCSKLSAILLALNSFLHHLCPGKDNYHQNSSGNAPLLKPLHYCSYVCTSSLFCHFFWKEKGFE